MLLSIENFTVVVDVNDERHELVSSINLNIEEQKIVALVGGSGSGKTTTGLSILRLLAPELRIIDGKITLNGEDLLNLSESNMRKIRGKEVSMVFQEPLNALNPVFSIGSQIEEVLTYHTNLTEEQKQKRIWELLDTVGIPEPKRVALSYPHQLSGGMRQRAMVAQAIAASPKLVIADEPTSSLDVTLQARVMELFRKLRDQLKISFLLITHDLGVVQHLADEVAVMNGGKIIESGATQEVLTNPQEAYTRELMEALTL